MEKRLLCDVKSSSGKDSGVKRDRFPNSDKMDKIFTKESLNTEKHLKKKQSILQKHILPVIIQQTKLDNK